MRENWSQLDTPENLITAAGGSYHISKGRSPAREIADVIARITVFWA